MLTKIDSVIGKQYLASSPGYEVAKQQYATATYGKERAMSPGLIVQAQSMDDVVNTIKYAKSNNVAVAIKTGGFMWGGFSSTSPNNIQLDLGAAFGSDDQNIFQADGKTFMRTSVSQSVGQFNEVLSRNNLFVPHGQCDRLFLGGHVQTGGYGQLARSFGLLGDHVVSLEMVNHSGEIVQVTKETDSELFFAVLGGSPGNFGVLTHFTVEVHQDADYAKSQGLKVVYQYSPEVLQQLLDILVKMSGDADFPRNYDLSVHVASATYPIADLCRGLEHKINEGSSIVVFAQYVPFNAEDTPDMEWFNRLNTIAKPLMSTGVQEMSMSKLTNMWLSADREWDLPYQKRLLTTNSTSLAEKQWSKWAVSRVDKILSSNNNDLYLYGRFQCIGGDNSQYLANANNGTAYSWRDTTMFTLLDCYHGVSQDQKQAALDWQSINAREAIGPNGTFCEEDRKMLWNPCDNWNLDTTWSCFYEDREKYERLQKARLAADPNGTFTPNMFSVKSAPAMNAVAPVAMATGLADVVVEVEAAKQTLRSN